MKKLFFIIDEHELLLDKILVAFNEIPVFFVCKSKHEYYIGLSIDGDSEQYFVSQISLKNLSCLLNGTLTMRDLLLSGCKFWIITAGKTAVDDIVTEIDASHIPVDVLPYEGEYLKLATKDLKQYATQINNLLYNGSYIAVHDLLDFTISNDILFQFADTIIIECQVSLPDNSNHAALSRYQLLLSQEFMKLRTVKTEISIKTTDDLQQEFPIKIYSNDERIWAA